MGSFLEARGRFRRIAHRVGSDARARVPGFLWDSDTPRTAGTVFERAICHRGNDCFPLIRSRACWSTYLCRLDAAASGRHSVSESFARVLGASGFSPHANPLFRVWAAMPTCGIGGPRAGQEAHVRNAGLGLARAGPRVCCGSLRSNCVGWGAWRGCYGGPIAPRTRQRVAGRQKGAAGPIQRMSPAA